jgi:hypothetical protein
VDENFPKAEKPNRQFSKTVFSEDGVERTGPIHVPGERRDPSLPTGSGQEAGASAQSGSSQFKGNRVSDAAAMGEAVEEADWVEKRKGELSSEGDPLPLPIAKDYENPFHKEEMTSPSQRGQGKPTSIPKGGGSSKNSERGSALEKGGHPASHFSVEEVTRLDDTFGLMNQKLETNWVSKITVAFLIAGIILFVYVLLW